MNSSTAVVGFYDAMGSKAVDYILGPTEMPAIVRTEEYVKRIIDMKKDGMAKYVQTLILMNEGNAEVIKEA